MRLPPIPLPILLLVSASLAAGQQTCYFPDGSVDSGDTPCKSSQGHSACCGPDAVCLSNGLCMRIVNPFSNRLSRGGCTDQSWTSDECPQFCADVATNGGTTLFLGPQTEEGGFCCFAQYDTAHSLCPNATRGSNQPFNLPAGAVQFDRVHGSTSYGPAFGLSAATSSSRTGAPTASATVTVTRSPVAGDAAASNTDAASAASTSSQSSPSPSPSSSTTASAAAVGAGVGVPLGVALVAALALVWVQRGQKQRLEQQLHALQSGWPEGGAAPYRSGGRGWPGMRQQPSSFSGASYTSQSQLAAGGVGGGRGMVGPKGGLELSHDTAIAEMEVREMPELGGYK